MNELIDIYIRGRDCLLNEWVVDRKDTGVVGWLDGWMVGWVHLVEQRAESRKVLYIYIYICVCVCVCPIGWLNLVQPIEFYHSGINKCWNALRLLL